MRPVEYAPFPRSSGEQHERRGFTRDISASGMCLRVDVPEDVGSLLRIVVADVDGRPALGSLGRVAWSRSVGDGVWHMGLSLVTLRPIQAAATSGAMG